MVKNLGELFLSHIFILLSLIIIIISFNCFQITRKNFLSRIFYILHFYIVDFHAIIILTEKHNNIL